MSQLPQNPEIQPPSSLPPCILVVEDDEPSAMVMNTFLDMLGYDFGIAQDGNEAVEAAKSGLFALILMDVTMPVMNGYEATRRIREFERDNGKKPVLIIGVTAHAFVTDRERSLAAGMNDHLSKPIDLDLLEKKLKELLKPRSD